MQKIESLKKESEFKRLYKKGASFANKQLVLIILKNNLEINRLGIVISKKFGKANKRNRCRRLIKESYRSFGQNIKMGYDIIIIPRAEAPDDFWKIKSSLSHLLRKQNLLVTSYELRVTN